MAIIVKHLPTDKKYVLIGTGFGAYKAANNVFIANHVPRGDEKEMTMAATCDVKGNIHWFETDDLKVIEIDGQSVEKVLKQE